MAQDFIVSHYSYLFELYRVSNIKSSNEIRLTSHRRYLDNSTITAGKEGRKLKTVQPSFKPVLLKWLIAGVRVCGLIYKSGVYY